MSQNDQILFVVSKNKEFNFETETRVNLCKPEKHRMLLIYNVIIVINCNNSLVNKNRTRSPTVE